jgi:hypothetical protein
VDICKGLAHGKTFFDLLEALYVFISDSAVHTKFIETQVLLNPKRKPIELKKIVTHDGQHKFKHVLHLKD